MQLLLMAAGGCCGVGHWEQEQRKDKVCICSGSPRAGGPPGRQVSSPQQSPLELGLQCAERYWMILHIKLYSKTKQFGRVEPLKRGTHS